MIAVIAAYSNNSRAIGRNGKLIWDIPSDKQRFRKLTWGNVVIMGRKTYEEIGTPLRGRMNIVLSKSAIYSDENLTSAVSLKEALDICEKDASLKDKKIFICGGQSVYAEAMPFADELYLSVIDGEYEGDAHFPEFDERMYECVYKEHIKEAVPYTFYKYIKR